MLALLVALASCGQAGNPDDQAPENQATASAAAMPALPAPASIQPCRPDGHLKTKLYGALDGELDWSAAHLECSGMPRPNGAGARLRFAGQVAGDGRRLAIIIAIPELAPDSADVELGSKVTLIDESSGRFFSTWDMDNCWTDITSLEGADDSGDRFDIGGNLYCVAPLAEVNGDASVSVFELSFAGSLDWSAK